MKIVRLVILVVLLCSQIMILLLPIHDHILRDTLKRNGGACVSFNSWFRIDKSWNPRFKYGVHYCDPLDYPPGVKDGDVGQILGYDPALAEGN